MKSGIQSIEKFIAEKRCFHVPLYQRKYQWEKKRLLPFWDDVERKAIEVFERKTRPDHFMGALILAPMDILQDEDSMERYQVADGQQRLVTFLLLLAAMRDIANEFGFRDLSKLCERYFFNSRKSGKKRDESRIKLKLHDSKASGLLNEILDMEYVEDHWEMLKKKGDSPNISSAYELFRKHVRMFVEKGHTSRKAYAKEKVATACRNDRKTSKRRLQALIDGYLHHMKVVVITLGDMDDPQGIFESLNSTGEPLLAMDLVRNFIFHRAQKGGEDTENLHERMWSKFDDNWWNEPSPNAKRGGPRIDHFLRCLLIAKTGRPVKRSNLYSEYCAFVVPGGLKRPLTAERQLELLDRFAPTYRTLECEEDGKPSIRFLKEKLKAWNVTSAYPIALQLGDTKMQESERQKIVELIYSYIVRRALCGQPLKNLDREFAALAGRFNVTGGPSVKELKAFFSSNKRDSIRFPSNNDLKVQIPRQPAYNSTADSLPGNGLKDILWELELASRPTRKRNGTMNGNMETEHVMPVTWTRDWRFARGVWVGPGMDDDRVSERKILVHTLGNLTLLPKNLNKKAGNKGFKDKKEVYKGFPEMHMNRYFDRYDTWKEKEIMKRSNALARLATKVWREI